jgi:hypothetical protein
MKGRHQLLISVNDSNFLGENVYNIIQAEALLATRKEVGLVVCAAKTKRVFISHQQNTRQNHNL